MHRRRASPVKLRVSVDSRPCWLAPLALLVFVASAAFHFADGSHASAEAHFARSTVIALSGDQPCDPQHNGHAHTVSTCSAGCPLCAPVIGPEVLRRPAVAVSDGEPESARHTGVVFTQFRPPKPLRA